MNNRLGLSLLALGAGVALLISTAFASSNSESLRGGTLRLVWGAEPDSLDTALANGDIGSWVLLAATCAKLFTTVNDAESGKARVVPEVVRTYIRSNGDRTYTFELKRTFRFHTRAPVTAQSFVEAFNRDALIRVAPAPVVRRGFIQDIIGADAVIRGQAKRISGVQALGRYRLRIRLKRPAGDLLARLTMPYFCPIPSGMLPERIDYSPGSGPYYIADHITNRRIVLERNPYYGGRRTANPDHIIWTIEPDPTERLQATERGDYDFLLLFNYPDTVVRHLVDEYDLNRWPGGRLFRTSPSSSSFKRFFRFNQEQPAFKGAGQAPLRKAINYVIDRPELARAGSYLAFRRSDRILPEALSRSRRLYPLRGTDPVAARRWLARAGWQPPTLTLYTTNFPDDVKRAEVFSYDLLQLGIKVKTQYFAFQELQDKLTTSGEPWDVAGSGGIGVTSAYPDPAGVFVQLLRGRRWTARFDAANRVTDEVERAKAWADLETDLMLNDPPVAAYAEWRPLFLVSPSLGCYRPGQPFDIAAVCKK